ncbi:MAG: EthD family reductase [Candidatus Rokuibacteriota bacterium]
MIRISVLYAAGEGKKFDHAYYTGKHMPLVQERLGSLGLKRWEADKGVAGGAPGAPAPFTCIGHLYFDSLSEFQQAMGKHGKELMADVPNFTNIPPQIQIAEIIA